MNRLRIIAGVSAVYDALVGLLLSAGRPLLLRLLDVPAPSPAIHADLNALFVVAVAAGYLIPFREPDSPAGRLYLWIMGSWLKAAGAVAFVLDHQLRGSPASFLLFAASDGALAAITTWALVSSTSTSGSRRP